MRRFSGRGSRYELESRKDVAANREIHRERCDEASHEQGECRWRLVGGRSLRSGNRRRNNGRCTSASLGDGLVHTVGGDDAMQEMWRISIVYHERLRENPQHPKPPTLCRWFWCDEFLHYSFV